MKHMKKRGFTLIELIVVIAILGILAAIAIPRLSGFTSSAALKADEATMNTVKNAVAAGIANGDINVTGTSVITTTEGATTNTKATYATSGTGTITYPGTGTITTVMTNLLGSNSVTVKEGTKTHVAVTVIDGDISSVVTN